MRMHFFGIAAALSLVSVGGVAQIPTAPASAGLLISDPNVIALYNDIIRTLAGVPATVGREQAEAQIAYTVDQSQANCRVVVAALREALGSPHHPKPVVLALRDVLASADRCEPYGTAAVGGAGRDALALGPAVGIGGGTSNYSPF